MSLFGRQSTVKNKSETNLLPIAFAAAVKGAAVISDYLLAAAYCPQEFASDAAILRSVASNLLIVSGDLTDLDLIVMAPFVSEAQMD